EEESLWSRFQRSKKESLNKSQDDSDDESELEEYPPYDSTQISSIGEGFSLEDDDLDCYDGYDAQGRCPLTPEEIGLLLQALGFNNETHLYLAYYKVYGREARISALRKLFQLMDDNKGIASDKERA
ncbi:hypothetical protein Tco_1028327, partial [Tanacetum coccineum]